MPGTAAVLSVSGPEKGDLMKFQKLYSILTFAGLLILFAGCSDQPGKPCCVKVTSGDVQRALNGEKFLSSVQATVYCEHRSLLGRKEHVPCPGVKVRFVPAKGSDLTVIPAEAVSDGGGGVKECLTLRRRCCAVPGWRHFTDLTR